MVERIFQDSIVGELLAPDYRFRSQQMGSLDDRVRIVTYGVDALVLQFPAGSASF